jgi:hypothetical protein
VRDGVRFPANAKWRKVWNGAVVPKAYQVSEVLLLPNMKPCLLSGRVVTNAEAPFCFASLIAWARDLSAAEYIYIYIYIYSRERVVFN